MAPRVYGVLCLAIAACAADNGTPVAEQQIKPMRLLDPAEMVAGKSPEAWTIEYARWTYAQTSCEDVPLHDSDGSSCASFQDPDSPVFFLEQATLSRRDPAPTVVRTLCRIPAGKAIFVPVTVVSIDDAGVARTRTDEQRGEVASNVRQSLKNQILIADGVAADKLEARTIGPVTFDYYVPRAPNYYTCNDGFDVEVEDTIIAPSLLVGTFAIFEAPSPGRHRIEYGGGYTYYSVTAGFRVDAEVVVDDSSD